MRRARGASNAMPGGDGGVIISQRAAESGCAPPSEPDRRNRYRAAAIFTG